MKTKYGEIESIYDLFEKTNDEPKWVNPKCDNEHLKITLLKFKCKICGDVVEDYAEYSAIPDDRWAGRKKHFELHRDLNSIGINKLLKK
ncbi:MAG TPA: hypothetical protein ENH85_00450 [Candidatus Scalindua sp.]|nr:hypothetical protein [Candidatus Scalindua sp.]